MGITNSQSRTRIDEIADRIYRISTPLPPEAMPGGFTFNQYLLVDDEPLLFHTGPRAILPVVREAIDSVIRVENLRWIAFAHVEADECGSLNQLLAAAPQALPLCGEIAAGVSMNDLANRPPRALADGEAVSLGTKRVMWLDAPHMPHNWECGYLFESVTGTLLCGDLFTQGGDVHKPLIESDILEPSEAFRKQADYFSHAKTAGPSLERLAATTPQTLACMHGSAWRGDGAKLIRELIQALETTPPGPIWAGKPAPAIMTQAPTTQPAPEETITS
jgi:flavorubredoxin